MVSFRRVAVTTTSFNRFSVLSDSTGSCAEVAIKGISNNKTAIRLLLLYIKMILTHAEAVLIADDRMWYDHTLRFIKPVTPQA